MELNQEDEKLKFAEGDEPGIVEYLTIVIRDPTEDEKKALTSSI